MKSKYFSDSKNLPNRIILILLSLVAIALYFFHLGVLPVSIMEARNFIVAREMLTDSNWIFTTLNGEIRYEKPPLPAWMATPFASVMGLNNVTAYRLPVAIVALGTLLIFYLFTAKLSDNRQLGWISTLVLATSFYFIAIQREAPSDMFAHGTMLTGIYFLWRALRSSQFSWSTLFIGGVFCGLSILSKGPVSLFALLLPFLIAFFLTYGRKSLPKKLTTVLFFLLMGLLIGGFWYWYIYYFDTSTFMEVSSKETGNWTSYNVRPIYYYWSFFVQSGIWAIPALLGLLYPIYKNKVLNKRSYLFAVIWTLSAVILLSLIPEKKPRYLMPVLIPLALVIGHYFQYLFKIRRNCHYSDKYFMLFSFGLMALIALTTPIGLYLFLGEELGEWKWYFTALTIVLLFIGIAMIIALWKFDVRRSFFLTIALMVALSTLGLPLYQAIPGNPEYQSMKSFDKHSEIPVFGYSYIQPELVWDFGQKIPLIGENDKKEIPVHAKFHLFVPPNAQDLIIALFQETHELRIETTYDLNPIHAPGERGHSERLVLCNYLAIPKNTSK